jgi:arylformamidase
MALIDLSHPIEDGMAAYPGLPPVRIFTILDHDASRDRYGGRAKFHLGGAELAGNTGTHLDAPFHRFRDREDLAALPLESVVGLPGIIVDPDGAERAVSLAGVEERSFRGRAFLVRTGWDARWGSEEYWSDAPFLPVAVVERLIAAGVRLVGVDFGNVDDTGRPVPSGPHRPARGRHSNRGEPSRPGTASARGVRVLGAAPRHRARRSVPGTGVRGGALSDPRGGVLDGARARQQPGGHSDVPRDEGNVVHRGSGTRSATTRGVWRRYDE